MRKPIPGAPTDEDGEIRFGPALAAGILSFECRDLEGFIGDVFLDPLSEPLFSLSFESSLLPAGRNSREDLLAVDEMVGAAAEGGTGRVLRDGGTRVPSALLIGGSDDLGTLVRVLSRVDIGWSRWALCDPDDGLALTAPNSEIEARASSFMLEAFAIVLEDHWAVRLADMLCVDKGGAILRLAGVSAGRLTIRGILVGVAEG